MSLGREQVVLIEAQWADGGELIGTGFVIRAGERTVLVTALHVVARVGDPVIDWAETIAAERFGAVVHAEYDLADDWVVFDVGAAVASPVLRVASAMRDDCHRKVSTFGFPNGPMALHGTLVTTDTRIRWDYAGEQHEVGRIQVFLHELAAGLDLRGVSGGTAEHRQRRGRSRAVVLADIRERFCARRCADSRENGQRPRANQPD